MEKKPRSLFAHALNYGLILGVIFILVSLIYYILNFNMYSVGFGLIALVVNLAIIIIVYIIGIKAFRDKSLGGKITYGQSFLTGLIIGLIGFIISALFSYIFYRFFEPDLLVQNAHEAIDKWAGKGLPEEQLEMMEKNFLKSAKPVTQLKNGLLGGVIFSVILSLIISIFIKKDTTVVEEIQ